MFIEIFEAFSDLGKLSANELKKGKAIDANNTSAFKLVTPRVFHKAITVIKKNDLTKDIPKGLDTLSIYSINEYKDMRCYLGENNSSGYALHGNELVSVFSSQASSANALVKSAKQNGARRLDCFAKMTNGKVYGKLYQLYKKNGFKIDTSMNQGKKGEPYSIQQGISLYVNDKGEVEPDNENIVIFMKL